MPPDGTDENGAPRVRRDNDGYWQGSDPWQGITNPEVWTAGVPDTWETDEKNRIIAADVNYGLDPVPSGLTPGAFDLPTTTPNANGSSRRTWGGGGGGVSGPSQQAIFDRENLWREEDRARENLWREEDRAREEAQRQQRIAAYDAYDKTMRGLYTKENVDARFDPLVGGVNTAATEGLSRLGGITDSMAARGVQSRSAVADAFAAGDARLQALRAQYGQQQAQTTGGFNSILSNMGVTGGVQPGSGAMDRIFANAQIGNARAGTIFDASAADRGALVGGLQGDVSTGMTRDKAALLARIAGERAQAQQASDSALAQALAQSGIARGQV
jgi:hypothetical protein